MAPDTLEPEDRVEDEHGDHIAFLDQAHQRLNAPIVLVWDNLNTHVGIRMRTLIAARDRLTMCGYRHTHPTSIRPRASGPG
ncbi:hypothetical protein [Micromonospora sp. NBC_01813]|uniref:hypothetical protein n=1 Tax=Micromonospora sp. NBC_01813 TaxID=2975988 RepID=UPI002DDA2FE8|nr:hypothetical protein [Micromonospora sp. NBC_01813]WSA07102.1 hypothetical protein OG958_22955 [Micromonospora sp. NBC_01813]